MILNPQGSEIKSQWIHEVRFYNSISKIHCANIKINIKNPFYRKIICLHILFACTLILLRIANSSDDYNPKVQAARRNIHFLDHVCSVSNKPFSKLFNYSMKRGSVDPSLLAKPLLQSNDNGILDVQQFLQKVLNAYSNLKNNAVNFCRLLATFFFTEVVTCDHH